MGVRSSSKELKDKDSHSSSSSTNLVASLMKSWRISSSSSSSSQDSRSHKHSSNHGLATTEVHSPPPSTETGPYKISRHNSSGDGNFDAITKQKTTANRSLSSSSNSYSPLRYVSPGMNNIESPRASFLRQQHNKHSHHNQQYYNHNNSSAISSSEFNSSAPVSSKKNSDKYFEDLDEDWSAVIDNYNMPIPMLVNGGKGNSNLSQLNQYNSGEINPENLSRTSTASSIVTSITSATLTQYPQFPHLHTMESLNQPISQEEIENEREVQELNSIMQRIAKFDSILNAKNIVNLQELRQLSWNGIPKPHRPTVWKLLIGYLPPNTKRQESFLNRKRQEYCDGLKHTFSDEHSRDIPTWHQIEIDIPRTNPHIPLYQFNSVHASLQRILYLWAIRHPASGYVQGINDLVTPFFQTFLTGYLQPSKIDSVETLDPDTYMTEEQKSDLEADTFWCLTKLLDQITDNYIHGQPGILKQVKNLSQLVKRIDADLYNHFQNEHVEFIQFAFRWMNCLLMREFQMDTVIRMWDTYLSETSSPEASSSFSSAGNDSTAPQTPNLPSSSTFTNQLGDHISPASMTGMSSIGAGAGSASKSRATGNATSSDESTKRFTHTSLNEFHVFVCAAFLIKWSDTLCDMDFQGIITFLQNPTTKDWTETDIEMLLSEAYIWQSLYKDATSHWQ